MFILGKKLNMTQKFLADGTKVAVTAIEVGPSKIIALRTKEKDGYLAAQIGFGKKRRLTRAAAGHQKGNSFATLREFRITSEEKFNVGDEIKASAFNPGEYIDVSGIMKGRGFAGHMKRHGFHGFPASHGHNKPRSPGSIGSRFPQHTLKGTRMAGRMGGHQVTVKNLMVVDVEPGKNLIWVSGAVPGANNGLVKIKTTGKKSGPVELNLYQKEEKKAENQPAPEAGDKKKLQENEKPIKAKAGEEKPAKEKKE